jgi:hypothetical protein
MLRVSPCGLTRSRHLCPIPRFWAGSTRDNNASEEDDGCMGHDHAAQTGSGRVVVRPSTRDRAADHRDQVAEERERTADNRDRIADLRERKADQREDFADQRELLADLRERAADARERQLDTRDSTADVSVRRVGIPSPEQLRRMRDAIERSHARLAMGSAWQERSEARVLRADAQAARSSAEMARVLAAEEWRSVRSPTRVSPHPAGELDTVALRRRCSDLASQLAETEDSIARHHEALAVQRPSKAAGFLSIAESARLGATRARQVALQFGEPAPEATA